MNIIGEIRLLKFHGITHAVRAFCEECRATPNCPVIGHVITLCHAETDVPWRNTSKRRLSKVDCMGCLVGLNRLCAG